MAKKGYKYYTNGIEEVCLPEGQCPEGWRPGVSDSHKKANSDSHKGKTAWNKGLAKDTDERVSKYSQNLVGHNVSQESRDKIRKSLAAYREENPSCLLKGEKNPMWGKHPTAWNKGLTHETDGRIKSGYQRSEETKDVISKGGLNGGVDKWFNTMKENNSFGKSSQEEMFEKYLIALFGKDDIETEYRDSRYSNPLTGIKFRCDFYIKHLDLFIELNLFPSHGPHPFNRESKEDLALIENCYDKDVWTIWDVMKLEAANKNKLNYKAIYWDEWKNDIEPAISQNKIIELLKPCELLETPVKQDNQQPSLTN